MKNTIYRMLLVGTLLLSGAGMQAQEFGLQLYSLRNQFSQDVEGSLAQIRDWGVTYIEGGGTYGYTQEEFLELLGKYGLKTAGIGASYDELRDQPEAVAEKAKAFGASYVMCAWIPHKGDAFGLKETEEAIAVFNRAGKVMEAAGLTLAYHAHGYEFRSYGEVTLFDLMAQQAEHFAFEMDIYWVFHGGADPLELLNRYPDKWVLMHLKDMAQGVKGNDSGHEDVETNVVLGTGQIDVAALVRRGAELGIRYMFIEDESSRVLEQVPQSLTFLRGL
ncbi:sugar phosphate isomerase/epimerase [Robiginitalea sp. M366]|uniref:sugar phosphate isomerase/epimerase family protein n=1 Tax=Robiginitalea aestuariiviva TaxID=3036903 RepID=UPI00240E7996|nr:sugar phosphate isomerase/epimerase [Robiginitalea aestuariiviva]MDG1572686.1 sugar phosphate isomerase/epimerase [Robiginitalea aestuariiviva]